MNIPIGDDFFLVKKHLELLGWNTLGKPKKNDNGYDLIAVGKKSVIRFEIKKVRKLKNNTWQTQSIEKTQHKADAVAVILPNNHVLFYKMDEFLKECSQGGYRQYTWLRPL